MHLTIIEWSKTIYLPYQLAAHQTCPLLFPSYEFPKNNIIKIQKKNV
jgi:hypothetical protein